MEEVSVWARWYVLLVSIPLAIIGLVIVEYWQRGAKPTDNKA